FLDSPFIQQFQKSPMGALLNADRDWRKINAGREQVEALLGMDWTKLRDDVLGDAVVFAYRPQKPDKPRDEQALFLLRARYPQERAKLIERVNALQKVGGEIKAVEVREHNGQSYFQRVDAKAAPFYALLGPLLIVASDEGFLRETLARRTQDARPSSAVSQRLQQMLGSQQYVAQLWLNPRAFDAAVAAKASEGGDEHRAVLKNVENYWKALEGIAVGVGLQDDATLT